MARKQTRGTTWHTALPTCTHLIPRTRSTGQLQERPPRPPRPLWEVAPEERWRERGESWKGPRKECRPQETGKGAVPGECSGYLPSLERQTTHAFLRASVGGPGFAELLPSGLPPEVAHGSRGCSHLQARRSRTAHVAPSCSCWAMLAVSWTASWVVDQSYTWLGFSHHVS